MSPRVFYVQRLLGTTCRKPETRAHSLWSLIRVRFTLCGLETSVPRGVWLPQPTVVVPTW